jgi:hypothetical protein
MNSPTLKSPSARLGYAFTPQGLGVRICRSCPDRTQAEREAKTQRLVIVLTVCPDCFQRLNERRHP